jgi:hypothetical protein
MSISRQHRNVMPLIVFWGAIMALPHGLQAGPPPKGDDHKWGGNQVVRSAPVRDDVVNAPLKGGAPSTWGDNVEWNDNENPDQPLKSETPP